MSDEKRQRLMEQGVEALADALLELAERDDAAGEMVERLLATPEENVKRFKAKIAGLKRATRFVSWDDVLTLSRQLEALLGDLEAAVDEPCLGTELVAVFFETDKATLERCDDSGGDVGDVYRMSASDLFVAFAGRCEEKGALATRLLLLCLNDDYGVREGLMERAAEFLPELHLRWLIERLQQRAEEAADEYKRRHALRMVGSLARQLGDAPLFEQTRLAGCQGEPGPAACLHIAEVWLESGDAERALAWVRRIPEDETFKGYERDRLLLNIHARLGDREAGAAIAWRIFRGSRSQRALESLLAVIGEERRAEVVEGEMAAIMEAPRLSYTDAAFLVECERLDEAERYLVERADQLDGYVYGMLLNLLEPLEAAGRPLVTTLLYRALLDSLLSRAYTKAYPHGVRDLKKLDRLAPLVDDWRGQPNHEAYKAHLQKAHGRKRSFWSRYEQKAKR